MRGFTVIFSDYDTIVEISDDLKNFEKDIFIARSAIVIHVEIIHFSRCFHVKELGDQVTLFKIIHFWFPYSSPITPGV